jgi:chemotaxis signal transduction protein
MTDTLLPALGAAVADQAPPAGVAYVLAELGGRAVAVPMASLLEVADLAEIAPAPLAPRWLLGVTNLRGVVVPVVDLAALLGWETGAPGRRALVLRDGRFRLALPVHGVHSVRWLDLAPAEETQAEAETPGEAAVSREVTIDGRPVWVVDAEAVLARVRQGEGTGAAGR